MDSIREMIEKRAYHLFLKRGGIHGYAVQDWFQAEKEIFTELDAKGKPAQTAPAKAVKKEAPAAPVAAAAPVVQPVAPVAKPAAKPAVKTTKKGKAANGSK